MLTLEIREASEPDLDAIDAIYTHHILHTHVTFDVEPRAPQQRSEWFAHYAPSGRHRLFVASADDRVVGFASSGRWRPKPAYETSVETSVYVADGMAGNGIGTRLYAALFEALEDEDVHRAYAGIALPNDASISLHRRFGFARVAFFSEQGRKFGRYWDVAWYERKM